MQQFMRKLFLWYQSNISKILLYTCCVVLAVLFVERLCIIFSYEPHLAGIDNNFDYPVIRSLAGFSIYPNPAEYPYAVNPYAPLFFIVCKWVAVIFHVTAADTIAVYRITRSVAFIADLGTCLLLFVILRRHLNVSKAASAIVLTLFFSIICYLGYTFNRSDAPFLFFYAASLFILLKPEMPVTISRALVLAALATLCIFSKQNGISLLILIPVWLLLQKNYKALFFFVFFAATFCIASFWYFENIYSDHFFSEHIIHALKNKIDPRWFYVYVFKLMAPSYLIIPLAVAFIIAIKSIAENNHSFLKDAGIIFILQCGLSTALSLKWGSSQGYFNESFLLAFILIAAFYINNNAFTLPGFVKTATTYAYPALLIFIIHITAQLYFFFINSKTEAKEKFNEQVQIGNYIKKEIGQQNKYVIDLSNADFNFFKNILYKESAAPNIDAVRCCTLPDNIFDYSGLLDGLKTGKILFLIESNGAPQNAVWGRNLQRYKKDSVFNTYTIYKFDTTVLKL